jgi:aquaporin Z
VSVGLVCAGRFKVNELPAYVVAQVLGAVVAAGLLYYIASGHPGDTGNLAANGYGEHSLGKFTMASGFVTEVVMTLLFLMVILGATDKRAPAGFAPIAIGLCLTLVRLISIPVTNTSVNPARSTGPAVIVGGAAIAQLWLFWVAPIVGAAVAGVIYRWFEKDD